MQVNQPSQPLKRKNQAIHLQFCSSSNPKGRFQANSNAQIHLRVAQGSQAPPNPSNHVTGIQPLSNSSAKTAFCQYQHIVNLVDLPRILSKIVAPAPTLNPQMYQGPSLLPFQSYTKSNVAPTRRTVFNT